MGKKKVRTAAVVAAIALGAMAVAIFLLRTRAHRGLALLELLPPGADLYAVADLSSLQSNLIVKKLLSDPPQFSREAEYERFVEATGFRYQSDLKQLALAKVGPDWIGSAQAVWDRPKVLPYLESQGAAKSQEQGQTVFSFGSSRPFRLVLLENDLVLFAVGSDPNPLRAALQRHFGHRTDAAASELQRTELGHIPKGSELWAVGRLDRLLETGGLEPRFGSLALSKTFLQGSKALYVSVESSPLGLSLQAQDLCDSAASAERIANWIQALLGILQAMPPSQAKPRDEILTILLSGVAVEQVQESVFLRWQPDSKMLSLLERISP